MNLSLQSGDVVVELTANRLSVDEWSYYWPMISKELDTIPQYWEDYWFKENINNAVMNGNWQAWGFGGKDCVNVIVLTQVVEFPANRFLQVILAFGNSLETCASIIEATLERFAIEADCTMCEIANGRRGWAKWFPRFKISGAVLKCKVEKKGVH